MDNMAYFSLSDMSVTEITLAQNFSPSSNVSVLTHQGIHVVHTLWTTILTGVVLYSIVLLTVFGNLLVLVAVYVNKKLQTTFNYYVVNLAITDFSVAVTAMSFHATDSVLGYWPFGEILCGVWIFFDYGMTFVSVFTLILISVDRFWSVTWSVHYRRYHKKMRVVIAIMCMWFFMMVLWLPPCIYDRIRHSKPGECIWEPSLNKEFVIIIAALGHHGACVLMLSCYLRVQVFMYKRRAVKASKCHTVTKPNSVVHPTDFDETTNDIDATSFHITNSPLETKSNSSEKYEASNSILHIDTKRTAVDEIKERKRHHHKRERTVFIALTYILIGYAVCWIPFHVVFDVSSVCPSCVPRGVYAVTFWMTYMNSTINPFLYNFSNPEFRNTFKKILYRCKGASLD